MKKIILFGLMLLMTFMFLTSCKSSKNTSSIIGTIWEVDAGEYWSITFINESECVFNDDGYNEKGSYIKKDDNITMMFRRNMEGKIEGNKMIVEVEKNNFVAFTNHSSRSKPSKNAFTGIWSGIYQYGENIIISVEGSIWTVSFENMWMPGSVIANYNGNTADINFYGEIGTATVSGNTLTLNVEGDSFTLTKNQSVNNAFTGTWTGKIEGNFIKLVVEGSIWTIGGRSFIVTYDGNKANIKNWGEMSTATVSGKSLTWNWEDGSSIILTKE